MYFLENFLYLLETFDNERGYVKSITNIYDIEKIMVEFAKPRSLFHSVLIFEMCKKFEKTASIIKTKIYEFENTAESKFDLETFLKKIKEINRELKIHFKLC